MRILIIGGFLGSGKTTTVLRLGKYLSENGYKVAIVVNEIGEIGVDGDVISKYGFNTKEIVNGCICCSLKMDLRYTVSNLYKEYDPDILLIEPTGIAFPRMINEEVRMLDLGDSTIAPLVTLIDGSRFKHLLKEMRHFSTRQIEDAEILVVNKTDLIKPIELSIVTASVKELNPGATVLNLSSKNDEGFMDFVNMVISDPTLCISTMEAPSHQAEDSIACSGVATYASAFNVPVLERDVARAIAKDVVESIKSRVMEFSPHFMGHIKLFMEQGCELVKVNVTAYYESPVVEIIDAGKVENPKFKILSAVSGILKEELMDIVDSCVVERFRIQNIWISKSHV